MNDLAAEIALTEISRHQREAPALRFYDPVDLVQVFTTPDGITRTLHMGQYQTISDAQEAAGITAWAHDGKRRLLSECGKYRIQPVST